MTLAAFAWRMLAALAVVEVVVDAVVKVAVVVVVVAVAAVVVAVAVVSDVAMSVGVTVPASATKVALSEVETASSARAGAPSSVTPAQPRRG